MLPCSPHSKLSGHLVDKSPGLGNVCLDYADRRSSSLGLGNFFHTSTSVSSDFRFFGQSCSGVAGLATCYPHSKLGNIWSTNLPGLGNVCLERRPSFVQPRRLGNFFHTWTTVSSDFRLFGQSCSRVAGLATLLPPLKAREHLVDKSPELGNLDD